MSTSVFMIAGEESGDVLGGALMVALKAQRSDLSFVGIGGDAMQAQGLSSLMPMRDLCVMGVFEIAMQLPRLLKLINAVVEEIEKAQPDIVLSIDLPDFNFRVAKLLKKRGIFKGKILHYVAPSVWAWRPGRAKYVSGFLDGLMCLFPFEPQYFEPHGLKAAYVGHPIIEQDQSPDRSIRDALELEDGTDLIGVYLGSREQELKKHGTIFVEALNEIYEARPNSFAIIPTLPHLEFQVRNIMTDCKMPFFVISDVSKKWNVMKSCDAALAVSGTVGLELSYMHVPHVIAYKANALTGAVVKALATTEFAHLTNIILGRAAIPEFLQGDCASETLSDAVVKLLDAKDSQSADFASLQKALTEGSADTPSKRAADFVLSYC